MKKIILILSLFISLTSIAQNEYIEIEVRDTITLKATGYEYLFSVKDVEPYNFNEDEDYDSDDKEKRLDENFKKLEKLLKSKNYSFKDLEASNYNVNDGFAITRGLLSVKVNTIQELNKLKKLAKSEKYITGTLGNLEYENEKEAEEQLIKKLIDKAKAKANMIALYSGLKIKKIVTVKEVKQIDEMNLAFTEVLLNYRKVQKSFASGDDLSAILTKSMVVKFSVK